MTYTPVPPRSNTAAVTQYAGKTHESNVSLHDEQKVRVKTSSWGGTQMHNLSKSHPNPYLFTDLFNKE